MSQASETYYEPLFDLEAPPKEPLDPKAMQLCIYKQLNSNEEKTDQEEEWNLRVTCTQEWFIRCSWINKLLFLELLFESTSGLFVLENVLKSIDSIFSKDVLESLSHNSTNFAYDKVPTDDNRALDENELNTAMKESLLWFLSQDSGSQIRVILRLLRLGGGGLVFSAYKLAVKIFSERQTNESETDQSIPVKERKWTETSHRDSSFETHRVTMRGTDVNSYDSASVKDFTIKKQRQLYRRQVEILRYKQLRGLLEDEQQTGKSEETIDYMQILPIWLNRRIMSHIDEKSLWAFKRVGKYWSKMIDESINEKSGRKAINAKINKIIGIKADKDEKRKEENGEEKEVEVIKELGAKDLINAKNENEKVERKHSAYYKFIFSRKCIVKSLDESFNPDRCGACDCSMKILACSTSNNLIHFYSLKMDARLDCLVFGLESAITCLTLHESKIHIFIGFRDGSLICKDFITNKTTATFRCHEQAVLSIVTTSSNFLSASEDNKIKYFQLWSGVCLLCIDLNPNYNFSSILLRNDKKDMVAIGTKEGFVILADVGTKRLIPKVQLHKDEIQQLTHDGDFLITGSAGGRIRIWNMNMIEDGCPNLQPYYDINVDSPVTALKFYENQIFSGCENGTVKIISLATGEISKSLKISSQTPIIGVDVTEDKPFIKLIIWHEEGIEIRKFSLQEPPPKKIPKEKDNGKSKQKAQSEFRKQETSEAIPDDRVRKILEAIETLPNFHRRRTYEGSKNPLKDRICTISEVRTHQTNVIQFKTDVFSETFNANPSRTGSFILSTFPRNKKPK